MAMCRAQFLEAPWLQVRRDQCWPSHRTVIADEGNKRTLAPARAGKRVDFSIDTFQRKDVRLPTKIAHVAFQRCHANALRPN
jgi:hypothetical protein